MSTENEKQDSRPTAGKSEKDLGRTGESSRNYDSTEQKKPREEPLATRTPEESKDMPLESGSEA